MNAAPGFYAERLGPGWVDHDALIAERFPAPVARAAARVPRLRGALLGLRARRGDRVAVIRREAGSLPALAVCAAPPGDAGVFVLELIRRPLPRTAWRRALYRLWARAVEGPLLRRGAAGLQVMSDWERDELARWYRLDPATVHHVPWAWREGGDREPAPIRAAGRRVFASGRTACDWETLFAAATGRDWELSVICSRADEARVRALAAPLGAAVAAEVPWASHDAELRRADVCAIALAERELSAGHVRLMAAVEAGVAVVCSDVRALEGYVVAGSTAELVAPGDPEALGAAVDALLVDPKRRRELRDAARERASAWTYREYFARLAALAGTSD